MLRVNCMRIIIAFSKFEIEKHWMETEMKHRQFSMKLKCINSEVLFFTWFLWGKLAIHDNKVEGNSVFYTKIGTVLLFIVFSLLTPAFGMWISTTSVHVAVLFFFCIFLLSFIYPEKIWTVAFDLYCEFD